MKLSDCSFLAAQPSELFIIERSDFFKIVPEFQEFAKNTTNSSNLHLYHSQMRTYMFLGMKTIDRLKWIMDHESKLLIEFQAKLSPLI